MIKKILYILTGLLLLVYVLGSMLYPKSFLEEKTCEKADVEIVDALDRLFISEEDVVSLMKSSGTYPVGKKLKDIDTDRIETALEKNKMIKRVLVYKTVGGSIRVSVYQRVPLLRVIGTGGNFYVDTEGMIMPAAQQYAAYVPLATGHISREFAKEELYRLAVYLNNNRMWDAQIEQIYVHADKDLELTPRAGNHQILLGKADDLETKFANLKLFYEQALQEKGWNRYSKINLKFKNQIICTRR